MIQSTVRGPHRWTWNEFWQLLKWGTPQIHRSRIIWALVTLVVLTYLLSFFVDKATFLTVANAVRFSISLGVFVAYFPDSFLYSIINGGRPPRYGYLIIGICGSWGGEAYLGGRAIIYRLLGRPEYMMDAFDLALTIVFSSSCAVLHMTSQVMQADAVPRREWIRLGWYVAAGGALAAVVTLGATFAKEGGLLW